MATSSLECRHTVDNNPAAFSRVMLRNNLPGDRLFHRFPFQYCEARTELSETLEGFGRKAWRKTVSEESPNGRVTAAIVKSRGSTRPGRRQFNVQRSARSALSIIC